MKHATLPRGGRLMTGLLTSLFSINAAVAAEIPQGTITPDRSMVRVGLKSQLAWQIQYPGAVTGDSIMQVRMLGSTTRDNKGHGNNVDGVDVSNPGGSTKIDESGLIDDEKSATYSYLPVELSCSINGSGWKKIFSGTQSSVVPTNVLMEAKVKETDVIDFAGRQYNKRWLPLYTTTTANQNVIILKNGDSVPSGINAFRVGMSRDYLKPYLSADGRTVKIGHLDVLVLFELGETNSTLASFDLQDLGVLVTFK